MSCLLCMLMILLSVAILSLPVMVYTLFILYSSLPVSPMDSAYSSVIDRLSVRELLMPLICTS